MRLVQHIIDSMAAKVLSPYALEYMSAHKKTLLPATKISETELVHNQANRQQ